MKLPVNRFLHAIRRGEKQIGLWCCLSSGFSAEVIAGAAYDWVLVDMEHSPNDLTSVMNQLQVFASSESTALVRPQWNDPVLVKRLLDTGAPGLLFPMVQNAEEARAAVVATRYPPRGIRGVSGSTRANSFGRVSDYFQRVEEETAVIVQLETQQALEHAEEIAAVDGISAVFFGPADLAADVDRLGQPMCNEVWSMIMPVAKKLIEKGMPVGTLVLDSKFAAGLLNEGFSFVACGTDTSILAAGADSLLADVKGALV